MEADGLLKKAGKSVDCFHLPDDLDRVRRSEDGIPGYKDVHPGMYKNLRVDKIYTAINFNFDVQLLRTDHFLQVRDLVHGGSYE